MMKTLATLSLGLLASTVVSASVINYESRATDSGVNQADYQASWNAQDTTIKSESIDHFTNKVAAGHNQHSHLNISFDVSNSNAGQNWWFQFAPDAGFGGAVYFDGNLVERKTSDLWWGYQWERSTELLDTLISDLDAGTHTLDVFWAEGCCNGSQSGRFSVDNGNSWLALSTDNLDAVGVSEPGTLALLGLGLAGLAASRRRQK